MPGACFSALVLVFKFLCHKRGTNTKVQKSRLVFENPLSTARHLRLIAGFQSSTSTTVRRPDPRRLSHMSNKPPSPRMRQECRLPAEIFPEGLYPCLAPVDVSARYTVFELQIQTVCPYVRRTGACRDGHLLLLRLHLFERAPCAHREPLEDSSIFDTYGYQQNENFARF